MDRLHTSSRWFRSNRLERRIADCGLLFDHLIPEAERVPPDVIARLVRAWIAEGSLSRAEAVRSVLTGLVFRSADEREHTFVVVEVSWVVHRSDIQRASDRAVLFARAGRLARPAVVGYQISACARTLAGVLGVDLIAIDELSGR